MSMLLFGQSCSPAVYAARCRVVEKWNRLYDGASGHPDELVVECRDELFVPGDITVTRTGSGYVVGGLVYDGAGFVYYN